LAIAQRAVERAGGTIALASVPGAGTTVTFSLPVAVAEAASPALPAP
jgi:signal transduction histidine kinase